MGESLYEHCVRSGQQALLQQWHPEKNGEVKPEDVSYGSKKKVWWVCEKGHEWSALIKARTAGNGCPYCANRISAPGENDLATVRPELVEQWHPTKNGELTPQDVVGGSHRKVWWRCSKGHEWEAIVSSRAFDDVGCPVCAGKVIVPGENDLASHFPDVAAGWHPTKNGVLTPEKVSPYSNRKVWWICEEGHEWQAAVSARTARKSACPYCTGKKVLPGFNDLASLFPKVAEQWHPILNGDLTPQMVTRGSKKKVWWQCPLGHVWKAVIYTRTGAKGCGCPVCAGKVKEERLERYREL